MDNRSGGNLFTHGKFIWRRNLLRNKHLGFKNQSLRKSFPVSRKGAGFRWVYTLQIRDLGCFVNSPCCLRGMRKIALTSGRKRWKITAMIGTGMQLLTS
jgi:hypothetical protein